MAREKRLISVVVPCYNEAANIKPLYNSLVSVFKKNLSDYSYELIFVNDGSLDKTLNELHKIEKNDQNVRVLSLSRNFGKEIATSAGIHAASGDAIVMIDADGQHPVALTPEFVDKWLNGAFVVTGVRNSNQKEGAIKKYGSKLFYKMFNKFTDAHLIPGSTDFRLINKDVQAEFIKLTERNRITRGLIDWLGFEQQYIYFSASPRESGKASYNTPKLFKLAINSFVSLSLTPLYFSVYAGMIIVPLSAILGLASIIEMLIGDPLDLNISGSAYLIILVLFLVGILLISQGIIAIYLSHIHTESQNRPLFIVDKKGSRKIND